MTIRLIKIFGILTAATGLSLLYFYYPATETSLYPGCALYSLTGFYCPACGSQRAFSHFLHGDFAQAIQNNILFIPALFTGIFFFIRYTIQTFERKGKRNIKVSPLLLWSVLSIILVFWIIRNIPVHPFHLLAPVSPD